MRKYLIALFVMALSGCAGPSKPNDIASSNSDDTFSQVPPAEELPSKTEEEKPAPQESADYGKLEQAIENKSEPEVLAESAKILGRNSKDLKALNSMAYIYVKNRKLDMAKILLARAIKDYPSDPSLACNLGVVNLLENRISEAMGEFQRALNIDDGHPVANYHLGAIHIKYKNFQKGLPLIERAYKKLPRTLVGPHYAEALRLAKRGSDAKKIFSEIKVESAREPGLVLNYAWLLVEEFKEKSLGLKMINRVRLLTEDAAILKQVDELSSRAEMLK